MTSVAIRTAPMTSTISPPTTPERMFESGRVVVMTLGIDLRRKGSINAAPALANWTGVLVAGRSRRDRDQPAQALHDAAARELAPKRAALVEGRPGRGARVVAVRAERVRVGL